MSSRGRSGILLNLARVIPTVLLLTLVCAVPPSAAAAAGKPALGPGGPLPLVFESNEGQADPAVRFLARGRGYGLFLAPTETVLVLTPPRITNGRRPTAAEAGDAPNPTVVRMRLVGADVGAAISGVEPLRGRSHYLIGEPSAWRRDVPTFARVRYTDIYPGVSLLFYGNERQLEYDFVMAPGADPSAVVLAFDGADVLRIDDRGDLVLATAAGELRLRRPLIYQEDGGERRPVDGGYVLADGLVRFHVATWDASRPLVIDPVLGYSTYLGGSSDDQGFGIAVDDQGAVYVTGSTISSNFPLSTLLTPFQTSRGGVTDAFVTKIDSSGSLVVYSTFLGGSGDDSGNAIAVDVNGNAFVAGTTNSNNFPLQNPFQTTTRGLNEAFVAKLDPTGSTLLYSTYVGSNTDDVANGIAIDALGRAYITGSTASPNFPNNNAIICQGTKSTGADAYVLRLSVTGDVADYCRFIGGPGTDVGQGIAVDSVGNVWVTGTTTSGVLGTTPGVLQPNAAGGLDAFVAKLDVFGNLVYLTHLGGTGDDEAFAIAVDNLGFAYIAGSTTSFNFPTLVPFQGARAGTSTGQHDAFVSKLSPDGSALVYSTYLGGTGEDIANGIAVNQGDKTVIVVGSTTSVDFPTVQPLQALGGRMDAFVTKITTSGAALVYSTYLGGTGDDAAQAVAIDLDGVAYLTGSTNSPAFPTQSPIQTAAGLLDAFVTQIADGGIIQFTATGFTVDETTANAVIRVQRTGDTSGQVTVDFATSDGTATAGADYTAVSTTLTFVPGQIVQTVNVPILDDVIGDGDETVVLTLTNATGGAVLGSRRVVNLTILDNEPAINFSQPTYTVAEGKGPAIIAVNRSGPTGGTVLVDFQTTDGPAPNGALAGQDYTAVARTLTFGPGVRTQLVSIPILQDTLAEGTETVTLQLLNVRGGSPAALLGVRSTAVLQITDEDDKGGNIQFSTNVYSVKEPGPGLTASAVITVTRTGGSASGVMVDFQAIDGPAPNGALAGTNYTPTAGTLTFAAGQTQATFTVPILNDPSVPRGNPLTVLLALTNFRGGGAPGTPITATLNIDEFQANIAFTASTFTISQTATSAPITVRRSGASTGTVTVNFSTTTENTTATPGVDFQPVAGTLTFPATNTTLTFMVPILKNPNRSGAPTVGLALAAGTGAASVVEPRTAVLTIGQTGPAGAIEFASTTFDVAENVSGGLATIGVIRSGGTLGGVTVNYATSDIGACPPPAGNFYACAGSDYTAVTGTLTFGENETFKTFQVPIIDDLLVEGVEALNLTLSAPGPLNSGVRLGVRSTAQLRIIDNELALGFTATNYTVNENGGSITVKVELTGVSATPVTVQYATSDGTATAGQDYVATSGTLTFAPPGVATGVRTRTFTIPILPDTLAEGTETINLTLSNPTGGGALITGRSTAVVSIIDDDQGGAIEFVSPTFSVVESDGVATISVKRTAPPGAGPLASNVTVDYATTDGTATAGLKYVATAGRLTFAAGETLKTFTIPIIDNTTGEGDQTVNLRLLNPGGGGTLGAGIASVLTIVDDDPYVTFSAPAYSAVESSGNLTVTVNRGGATTGQVTVNYATADQRPGGAGKAVGGVDYTPTSGTLTFAPGARIATFQVPILNNAQPDPDRKFDLLLTNAVPASTTILAGGRAVATITDDDSGGVVQFSAPTFTVNENGGAAVVTVIRTGGSAGGVSVLIETVDPTVPVAPTATATVDYTPLTTGGMSGRRVTFGTGETTKTVRIPILPDALAEGVEQFDVKLSAPCVGAIDPADVKKCLNTSVPGAPTIGPQNIAAVLIVDAQTTVQFTTPEFATIENSPAATLTVDRTGPPQRLLVDYVTADLPGACPAPMGSARACAGIDYRTTSGTLTFEADINQQRITVPLVDNQAVDIPRLFSVQLSNLRHTDGTPAATLGPRTSANVKIKEDDRGGAFSVTGGQLQETNGTTTFTVTIRRAGGTGGPVSVFFHAKQCGAPLTITPPQYPLPLNATVCDFPAAEGIDFDPIEERIVFLPGELSKTRTIVVHGNAIPEGSRDIRVQLTQPLTGIGPTAAAKVMQDNVEIGATLGGAEQLVRIMEDDLYFVFLSSDNYSVTEGAREALITVIRNGLPTFINQPLDLDMVAITAGPNVPVAGLDFVDLGPGPAPFGGRLVARENPFHFNPGETSKTFRVPLLDDTIVDGEKDFFVYIRSAAGSGTPSGPGIAFPSKASLKVSDDDSGGTIEFSSTDYIVAENVASGFATITVSRTGVNLAGGVTVSASTVDMAPGPGVPIETAVPNVDYTPIAGVVVNFNAGDSVATFQVPILNDGLSDGVKTVQLKIAGPAPLGFSNSPALGARDTALLHIVDVAQTVAFAHDQYTVVEGGGMATITLERTGSLAGVLTVDFATVDQTALAGRDYTATSGTVTFPAGVSQVDVSVPIIDNTTVAADKTLGVTLANPSVGVIAAGRGTATLTITDDDKGGSIAFASAGFTVAENGGPAIITIIRTDGTAGCPLPLTVPTPPGGSCLEPTLVTFSTADGTATQPGDYTATSVTVEFGAGETVKTVTVPIVSDGPGEGTETVNLSLTNPLPSGVAVTGRGPTLGSQATAVLSIIETEFRIGATAYTFGEGGGPAIITVVRMGDLSGTATLDFVTVDGTAVSSMGGDFTGVSSGQLTFAAQESVKTLSVTLNDDTIAETDESFDIVFSNPVGATIARDSCATALPAAPPPPAVPPLVTSCTINVNILDNEMGGTITFSLPVFAATEPATPTATATITVRRTAGGAAGVTVDFATGDDTALDGRDYDAATGTLTFGLGETAKTFDVTVRNGVLGVRSANLFLQNATGGASIGTPDTAALRITDRDNSIGFSALSFTVAENGGAAAVTVRRTGATSTVLVDFATADQAACPTPIGSTFACAGSDYTAVATTLTFPAGATQLTVMVPITNDGLVENNETFAVVLSNPRLLDTTPVPVAPDSCVTSTATTCTASVQILDDDLGGVIQFSADAYQIAENAASGQATITLTRTGGVAGGASVQLDTTIGAPASQTVTFASGQPTVTALIAIADNALADGNRSATLTLSNPQPSGQPGSPKLGTRTSAVLNILDDEPFVSFTTGAYAIGEGAGPAVISVVRQGSPTATVLVDFAATDGTATTPRYTPTSGTLTFGPNVFVKTFPITIGNDTTLNGAQTVVLTLSNPRTTGPQAAGILGTNPATLTINDDDRPGTLSFSSGSYSINESAGPLTVTINRSAGNSGGVSVDYVVTGGTAVLNTDYTVSGAPAGTGTVTFNANETFKNFTITPVANPLAQGPKTVILTLQNATGTATLDAPITSTVTILDQEQTLVFSTMAYSFKENGGPAAIVINRVGPTTGTVLVDFTTVDGTASATAVPPLPADYTAVTKTLTFGPGVKTQTVMVPITNDGAIEGNETFSVRMSNPRFSTPGGAVGFAPGSCVTFVIGPPASCTVGVTIVDDDSGGAIQFSAATYTVSEASATATITLTRTGGLGGPVTVHLIASELGSSTSAGQDYVPFDFVVQFDPGVTTKSVAISIINDTLAEGTESLQLRLTSPTGGAILGARDTAILNITDNDIGGTIEFSAVLYKVSESAGMAAITIVRTGGAATNATVDFMTADPGGGNGGIAGVHYTPTAVAVTFGNPLHPNTETVMVPVLANAMPTGNKYVRLMLVNPRGGAKLGAKSVATLQITDNEATVQLSAGTYTVNEGGSVAVVVERTGTTGTAIVTYSTANLPGVCPAPAGSGRACAGVDYTAKSGTLTFAAGVTSLTFNVATIGNAKQDGNRAFAVNLSNPGGTAAPTLGPVSSATVTIVDDDKAGVLAFFGSPYKVSEFGTVNVSVRRASTTVAGPVTVNYTTVDGSAKAGVDYVPAAGTLTFGVGATIANFTVTILPNSRDDGDRTFTIALSAPTGGATLGSGSSATVLISDDDVGGTIQFSAATYSATECATTPCFANLTVSRTGGGASGVSVDFVTVDGTGDALNDYIPTSGTVSFGTNQTTAIVQIPLRIEPGAQPMKTFGVILSTPRGGAVLGARTMATVNITDTR